MASLADTMSMNEKRTRRTSGGQLVEDTQEEIQSLTQQAGLAVPPTTPIGQAMIGANPDQQKMAGTPAQKDAALSIATGEQDLATSQRREAARTQETGDEQAKREKAKQLGGLSGIGERVQQTIDKFVKQAAGAQAKVTMQGGDQISQAATQLGVSPGQLPAFQAAMQKYISSGGADMQALAEANQAAGKDVSTVLGAAQLTGAGGIMQGAGQTVGSAVASAIKPENVNVADLVGEGGLGYAPEDLDTLLGLAPGAASKMSLQQLQEAVKAEEAKEFARGQSVQAQAAVGGAAEQAAASKALRGFSGAGVTSTEAEVGRIEDAVAKGDVVKFGGKDMKVSDLLNDANMTKLVSDYVTDPNSAEAQALKQNNPEFAQFLEQHKGALETAVYALNVGIDKFGGLQKQYKETFSGLEDLDDETRAALVPGLAGKKFATSDEQFATARPILTLAKRDPNIKAAIKKDPQDAKDLAELDATQIQALDIGKPGSKWDKYQAAKLTQKEIAALPDDDVDAVLKKAFGTSDTQSIQQTYDFERKKASMGLPNNIGNMKYLDADGDGYLDSPAQMKERLASMNKGPNLKQILGGHKQKDFQAVEPPQTSSFGSLKQESAYQKLEKFTDDRKIAGDEINQAGLTLRELMELRGKTGGVGSPETQTAIQQKIDEHRSNQKDWMKGIAMKETTRKVDGVSIESPKYEFNDEAFKRQVLGSADDELDKEYLQQQYDAMKADYKATQESEKRNVAVGSIDIPMGIPVTENVTTTSDESDSLAVRHSGGPKKEDNSLKGLMEQSVTNPKAAAKKAKKKLGL